MPRHSPSPFPLLLSSSPLSPLFHFISADFPNPPSNPISHILLGMFLIAKIVRGRRLLHQLEQEVEKEKAAKALEQREKLAKFGLIPQQQDQNHALGMGHHQMDSIEVEGGEKEIGGGMAATSGIELAEMGGGGMEWEIKAMSDQQQAERVRQRRKRAVRQRTDSSLPSGEETDQALAASREQAMRRTSSMPSIVECEQHLHHLHLPHHQLSVFPRKGLLNAARPIRHYNYEDKLSKLQKRALRFTWQRLLTRNGGKRIESVFEEVFDRMMRSLPIMREMFNTRTFISAMSRCEIASPRDHARLIVKMFEMAIKNLEVEQCKRTDTASDFDPKLLGQAHSALRPYGFTSALWEAFGEAVIDIVLNQEAVRDLPGASQAWVVLTACLVDQLRAGFESVRECPFKRNQQKENQQMNGREGANQGGVADEEGGGGGKALATERHNQNQKLGDELALYQQSSPSGRRRTITLAEEEECLAEGIGTLGAAEIGHHFGRERRSCFSIMPGMEGGNGGKEGGESAHSRVQLKFLQDMASTEL